jgi:hypothetical protein
MAREVSPKVPTIADATEIDSRNEATSPTDKACQDVEFDAIKKRRYLLAGNVKSAVDKNRCEKFVDARVLSSLRDTQKPSNLRTWHNLPRKAVA